MTVPPALPTKHPWTNHTNEEFWDRLQVKVTLNKLSESQSPGGDPGGDPGAVGIHLDMMGYFINCIAKEVDEVALALRWRNGLSILNAVASRHGIMRTQLRAKGNLDHYNAREVDKDADSYTNLQMEERLVGLSCGNDC